MDLPEPEGPTIARRSPGVRSTSISESGSGVRTDEGEQHHRPGAHEVADVLHYLMAARYWQASLGAKSRWM